jgi:hypothetical protein
VRNLDSTAILFFRVEAEIDQNANSTFEVHFSVMVKVGMNIKMSAVICLVKSSTPKIGITPAILANCPRKPVKGTELKH